MNEDMKKEVSKVVSESSDLVTALEAVGAMYGIPSSNIIVDDSCKCIKVINDQIICPRKRNPSENIKSIICAVGAVLDFISQRINDKLDKYHEDRINHEKIVNSIAMNANPEKGKVVARFTDDDGGEIFAYHTGLVDFPKTPAGRAKLCELREKHMIPDFNIDIYNAYQQPCYFTEEEDDITTGIDMGASANETTTVDMGANDTTIDNSVNTTTDNVEMTSSGPVDTGSPISTTPETNDMSTTIPNEPTTNDVASQIQESATYLDLIDEFNGTTHLGYDLLQAQGFDYVKPVESFFSKRAPRKTK